LFAEARAAKRAALDELAGKQLLASFLRASGGAA